MAAHERVERGAAEDEAEREARKEFGNVGLVTELARDAWGWRWVAESLRDLRFGARMLRKNPGFTAICVLTLALGIGGVTAIFSIVDAVLLKPLAVEDPARLVFVQEQWRDLFAENSVGNYAELRKSSKSLASVGAGHSASFNLATDDVPVRVSGEMVTADYFATFGVAPLVGRTFSAEEDTPGNDKVVVLSERLWRTRLHADTGIVGRTLRINGLPLTVVGVMPKNFDPLLSESEIWVPAAFTAQQFADYDNHFLDVVGRLKPGVSVAQLQSELEVIAERLRKEHPVDNADRGLHAAPLTAVLLGDQREVLRLMLAAVAFVLLIACGNIANLQLARARTRQKETALRAALGASGRRIIRQLLAENVALGLAGGAAGVLLAFWGLSWIVAHGPPEVPRLADSRIDASTLGFALAVTLLSSFLFGLAPALRSASPRLAETFKESTGTGQGARDRVRSLLVAGEIALALILMAGAGLMVRSAMLVSRLSPGFDTTNLMVGRVGLPNSEYHEPAVAQHAFERIIAELVALPGAQSVAVDSRAPLTGGESSNGVVAEGRPLDPSSIVNSQLQIISPAYLATARIPLKAGREFEPQDTRERKLVTIVNETLARTLWPGENPIGKRFACCEPGPKGQMDPVWHEVVGVAADVRAWGLDHEVKPEFYIPMTQMPASAWDWIGRTMDITVRMQGGTLSAHELQSAVASVAPGVPIYRLSTMEQKIAGTLRRSRFDTFLLAIFAGTALLLSTVGIYGVLSFIVSQRTRDIGIRMALGASRGQVLRDVLGYGMRLTGAGLLVGIAGSLAATRLLSSLLYGVSPLDALTFSVASAILAGVALLASYLPARRATEIDPIVALRYE